MASGARTVLLIGSGPIQIGQAAEFDYSGAQACRALQEEGARVVLVNSNPATIMTDTEMADRVYIEPITTEAIAEIIREEQPDGVIAGLGGQTGLNVTAELAEAGVLEAHDVEVLGTPLETIYATEDRDRFRRRMREIDQPVPHSTTIGLGDDETVTDIDEGALRTRIEDALETVGGLPVIARTTYTLGGSGSGVVNDREDLFERVRRGLRLSRNNEVLVTEAITGWIELEYEVMRDAADSCLIICNMENLDPMGIHTGESIVVTPSQVIPDEGHQAMRNAALEVIRELGIQGGCNIQFAWRDDGSPGGEYRVVEVNPRVSRSSALASKATGYPIARVTAKVALGKQLHEIENEITGETTAAFEPAIDYVVTKIPRWPADKFEDVDFTLGTAMKSTGEAMAIGRTFEESFLKALRSTEYEPSVDWGDIDDTTLRVEYLETPTPDRPSAMLEAFDRGFDVDAVATATGIHPWYVERYARIAAAGQAAADGEFAAAAGAGYTNRAVAQLASAVDRDTAVTDGGGTTVEAVEAAAPERTYKQVDTCAGEFAASTPYYYSARAPIGASNRNEIQADTDVESVVIVGGGPIRIGQGVEFDYCTVHAVEALRDAGVQAHVVNNNPETVSTDYDISDGLFFEPITAEEIADVIAATEADGVMVQFGGQTSVNVGEGLESELERRGLDCEVLGSSVDAMDLAENRDRFNARMADLGIAQPDGGTASSEAEAIELAHELGYPVLVRPSYVLGGRAMQVVHDDGELRHYLDAAVRVSPDHPVLVDEFLEGAIEVDVDAVADGDEVFIGGILEHIESAGVHSGDSACAMPPPTLGRDVNRRIREVTEDIARALDTVGLLNVQLAVRDDEVHVLEANPRSSRTVPFVSKATGVPIAKLAARVMLGASLEELDVQEQVPVHTSVKEVVLPFDRLPGSDPRLGPEMKSTGEVMGTAGSFGRAYDKAQQAIGKPVPRSGTAVVDLSDPAFPEPESQAGRDLVSRVEERFELVDFAEEASFREAIRAGEIDLIISRARAPLNTAVEESVTYFSTFPSARAAMAAVETADEPLDIRPLEARPQYRERWGQPKET
jgi:carbamoyl-phosphate synthase large subunit